MPRITLEIAESVEEIDALIAREPEYLQPRLAVLRALRYGSARSLAEAARLCHVNEKSARRWWKIYEQGGIDAFIDESREPEEVQPAPTDESPQWITVEPDPAFVSPLLPEALARLLNVLGDEQNILDWANRFKVLLQEFLGDVDRITINIASGSYRHHPERPLRDGIRQTQHVNGTSLNLITYVIYPTATGTEALLEHFRHLGYPVDMYRTPVCYEYHDDKGEYLATLFIWREKEKPPVSSVTMQTIASLAPFLRFVFSSSVQRFRQAKMVNAYFAPILEIVASAELTTQEHRLLQHLLYGYSHREIADQLNVSVATVKKHMANIHKKTETSSLNELFGKYFSPRIMPKDVSNDPHQEPGAFPSDRPTGRKRQADR